MSDKAAMADDEERIERGPHAALRRIGLAGAEDGRTCALHGAFKAEEDGTALFLRRLRLDRGTNCAVLEQCLAKLFRRHLARDITGGVTSHAVCHDEEVPLLIDEEAVFVVFADAADIGRGPKKNR